MSNITLQINLSPGYLSYAHLTVPALINSHRCQVAEILLVVDCCRPGKSQVVDPDVRFPEPAFSKQVEQTRQLAQYLLLQGYCDQLYFMESNCEYFSLLSRKYTRSLVTTSHAYRATGFMSYHLGIELPRTRYVLHYDADMLLYQAPGYDWTTDAVEEMQKFELPLLPVARYFQTMQMICKILPSGTFRIHHLLIPPSFAVIVCLSDISLV